MHITFDKIEGILGNIILNVNEIGLVIVGIIWGITDPFLAKQTNKSTMVKFTLSSFLKLFGSILFFLPFVLN